MAITQTPMPSGADVYKAAKNASAVASLVTKGFNKTSLSRLSQDSIFQFPLIASADILAEELITISQGIERNDAAMLVSAISLRNKVDLNKYGTIQNYLKTFHNNKAAILPSFLSMINYAAGGDMTKAASESATLYHSVDLKQIALECWNDDIKLNQKSLNDLYKPYSRNERMMTNALESIKNYRAAMEAGSFVNAASSVTSGIKNAAKSSSTIGQAASAMRNDAWKDSPKPADGTVYPSADREEDVYDNQGRPVLDRNGNVLRLKLKRTMNTSKIRTDAPSIVNMQKLASLEPTLVNVPFIVVDVPGKGSKAQPLQWTQNVVIGIKNMIRPIPSSAMISNMVDCVRSSNKVFGFIKWTKGELKTSEFITGAAKSKDIAMATGASKYLKALRRRKLINNVTRFFDQAVPPNSTILITTAEAEMIRQQTGVDLTEVYYAAKILNEYYLLAFGIYDTENKTLQVLYDGDTDWAVGNIAQIRSNLSKNRELQDVTKLTRVLGNI